MMGRLNRDQRQLFGRSRTSAHWSLSEAKRTSQFAPQLVTKEVKCHELPLYLQLRFRYDSALSSCTQMAGKQAKVLSKGQVEQLLAWCLTTRQPIRNRALVLLSVKAGLRAAEIANLTWDMVVGPTGAIASILELRDEAAKNGSGRRIPLHPDLRYALTDLRHDEPGDGAVIRSERGALASPSCGAAPYLPCRSLWSAASLPLPSPQDEAS